MIKHMHMLNKLLIEFIFFIFVSTVMPFSYEVILEKSNSQVLRY